MFRRNKGKFLTVCVAVAFLLVGIIFAVNPLSKKIASAASSSAAVTSTDEFYFYWTNNSTYAIGAADYSIQYVSIPEEYDGIPITEIASYGFAFCSDLEEIYIPDSIETIGYNAFSFCDNLKIVDLAAVEIIEDYAFSFCDELEIVVLPDTVEYVGDYAFMMSDNATIYTPLYEEQTLNWGYWMDLFNGIVEYDYKNIICANNLVQINGIWGYQLTNYGIINNLNGDYVLDSYDDGVNGELPILEIYQAAFRNADIRSLAVGTSHQYKINIRNNAFANTKIRNIWLSDNVTFEDNFNLQPNQDNYGRSTGVFASSQNLEKVYLPDSLTEILPNMFQAIQTEASIQFIGNAQNNELSVSKIATGAFANSKLPYLSIPSSVQIVKANAFNNWTLNQNIDIDFYDGYLPVGWDVNWKGTNCNTNIEYKKITFDKQGGTGGTDSVQPTHNAAMPAATAPTRVGYVFDGYYTGANGTGTQYYTAGMVSKANFDASNPVSTLYAKWVMEITFNSNGGSGTVSPQVNSYGNKIYLKDATGFTRTGYYVAGWQSDSGSFTSGVGTSASGIHCAFGEYDYIESFPSTLYAVWKPITVTITFDPNGGSGSATQSGLYDNYVSLRNAAGFTRTGYYVEKWQTQPGVFQAGVGTSKAGIQYDFGTNDPIQNFVTLVYAVWKPIDVTITFSANGGSGTTTRTVKYDNEIELLDGYYLCSRTGYYVTKWQSVGGFTTGVGTPEAGAQYWFYSTDLVQNFPSTLYAVWTPHWYYIIFNANGGQGFTGLSEHYYDVGKTLTPNGYYRSQHRFIGWSLVKDGPVDYSDGQYIFNDSKWADGVIPLFASWQKIIYDIDFYRYGSVGVYDMIKYGTIGWNESISATAVDISSSYVFDHWEGWEYPTSNTGYHVWTFYDRTITVSNLRTYSCNISFYAMYTDISSGGGCIAPGTLITLADGSQKAVELLTGDELLLVWNHHTGAFDFAPIIFVDSDELAPFEIYHLYFSDGTEVKVIYEHAFWNVMLNRYVFIRDGESTQYIGDWFNKQTVDGYGNMIWTSVQLVDIQIYTELTTAWSPVTFGHLNFYVNGMLSMPGATEGLINIFDVDAVTMQYDQAAFLNDIAIYGLLNYTDVEEFMPQMVFEAFNVQFLAISMGKELITWDDIYGLLEQYAEFFDVEEQTEEPTEPGNNGNGQGNNGNGQGNNGNGQGNNGNGQGNNGNGNGQ